MQVKQNNDPNISGLKGLWRVLPHAWHPFIILARFDRPIGWWLLLLPSWWILAAFSRHLLEALGWMWLFLIGAIVMRAAGCVVNDLWDRDLDKQVARTRSRPLASGQVTSKQAVMFLFGLCGVGLVILLLLPPVTWAVGLFVLPLIVLYPLAKRVTHWPQAVLGLTFSWGVFMAASVVLYEWNLGVYLIYFGTAFWVMGYDTIYALQDKQDDRKAGVKSSAVALGGQVKRGVGAFYGCAILLWAAGFLLALGAGWWLGGLGAAAGHLAWQVVSLKENDPKLALKLFKANRDCGLLMTIGFLVGMI